MGLQQQELLWPRRKLNRTRLAQLAERAHARTHWPCPPSRDARTNARMQLTSSPAAILCAGVLIGCYPSSCTSIVKWSLALESLPKVRSPPPDKESLPRPLVVARAFSLSLSLQILCARPAAAPAHSSLVRFVEGDWLHSGAPLSGCAATCSKRWAGDRETARRAMSTGARGRLDVERQKNAT